MKTSTKIWLCITGALLIALGVVCICNPAETLFATAWLIGCLTLFSGIAKLIFTFRTQAFLPNSGSRMLSGFLDIIIGCIFLGHNFFVALSLPVVFAVWVMIEGIMETTITMLQDGTILLDLGIGEEGPFFCFAPAAAAEDAA